MVTVQPTNNALQEDENSPYNMGLVLACFGLQSNATKSRAVSGDAMPSLDIACEALGLEYIKTG